MSQTSARLIFVASVVVAAILLFFAPRIADRFGANFDKHPSPQKEVGLITQAEGKVSLRRYLAEYPVEASSNEKLLHLDRLEIENRARARLDLSVGASVEFSGPAEVVIERWNPNDGQSPLILHLIAGEFRLLKDGPPGKLFAIRQGRLTDANGAAVTKTRGLVISSVLLHETDAKFQVKPSAESAVANSSVQNPSLEDQDPSAGGLPNSYLDSEIGKQAEQFQKCQANAIRDQLESKGELLMGLTIQPDGRVSEARILSTTLKNDPLQGCVTQIFSRMKFKPFTGAVIVRSYPLKFE